MTIQYHSKKCNEKGFALISGFLLLDFAIFVICDSQVPLSMYIYIYDIYDTVFIYLYIYIYIYAYGQRPPPGPTFCRA